MKLLYILLVFSPIFLKGQDVIYRNVNPCSGILSIESKLYNKYPYINYKDFLEKYVPKRNHKFISLSNNNLINLNNDWRIRPYLYFSSSLNNHKIDVEIFLSETFSILDTGKYSRIYGELKEDSLMNLRFDSINILFNTQPISVPSNLISDLINPNILEKAGSYRPIESYFSKDKKFLYIYIQGQLNEIYPYNLGRIGNTYIAKIIFEIKTKRFDRIVIPGGFLNSYGWVSCPTFWPF